jgi:hypothetical protein
LELHLNVSFVCLEDIFLIPFFRFGDRDIFSRFAGIGPGHKATQSVTASFRADVEEAFGSAREGEATELEEDGAEDVDDDPNIWLDDDEGSDSDNSGWETEDSEESDDSAYELDDEGDLDDLLIEVWHYGAL